MAEVLPQKTTVANEMVRSGLSSTRKERSFGPPEIGNSVRRYCRSFTATVKQRSYDTPKAAKGALATCSVCRGVFPGRRPSRIYLNWLKIILNWAL